MIKKISQILIKIPHLASTVHADVQCYLSAYYVEKNLF